MGQTFGDLLDDLLEARDADYRSDPERAEIINATMLHVVQRMLEKLRDKFDPC